MSVRRHADLHAFLAAAAPMIARSELTANTILAVADAMRVEPPEDGERVYLATFDGPAAKGVAIQRRDYPVRIEDSDVEAARAFARDLAADWTKLSGVVGVPDACDAFVREWQASTGCGSTLRFRLRRHVLTAANDVAPAPGSMRTASAPDLDWLDRSVTEFVRELGLPNDPHHSRAMPARIARGEYRIWDDAGAVALAGWFPAGEGAARIGPVWTVDGERRKGYATALVASLSSELLASGYPRIYLDTDLANPTSNAIYARVGFQPLHDFCHFDFVAP